MLVSSRIWLSLVRLSILYLIGLGKPLTMDERRRAIVITEVIMSPEFALQVQVYLQSLNTERTRQTYARALADFHAWYVQTYGEEPDATLLTDEEAREWRHFLANVRRLSASTVNQRLAALKGLARFHGRDLRVRGMKKVLPPVEPLNGRELGRLLAAVEGETWQAKRDVAILNLMARAGLRVSEVVALCLDDVRLNRRKGHVTVRASKGLKERTVPLPKAARDALRAYLDARPSWACKVLFVSRTGRPLTPRDVQRLVEKAARRAGLSRRVTPHTLRHTYATRALRQGVDLATLARLLGHESLTTTARYLHPDEARVAEMVEGL